MKRKAKTAKATKAAEKPTRGDRFGMSRSNFIPDLGTMEFIAGEAISASEPYVFLGDDGRVYPWRGTGGPRLVMRRCSEWQFMPLRPVAKGGFVYFRPEPRKSES